MSDETQRIDLLQETRRNLNAGKVVFSRFELERELGSGGMGVVWLARDLEVEGRVALKFLPGLVRDPIAERDLRDEVKNARDLVHENIVSVRTLHKDEASIAVEMEYVDGPNVTMLVRDTPNRFLEVGKAGPIVAGLCLAIDHAWAPPRRLVHRDIKPHNLLINSAGHVKVVDFGIAHTVSETVTRLTGHAKATTERVVGTLPYMSPQQLKGEVHHSNDIYSIGATIYHILTGTPPFRATDPAVLTQQINQEAPVLMAERRKQLAAEGRQLINPQSIPRVWEETVAACLAKDPAKRPATAREIAVRLGLVEARDGAATGGRPRRRRWVVPAALVAIIVLAAGGATWFLRGRLIPTRVEQLVPAPTPAPPSTTEPAPGTAMAPAPPKAPVVPPRHSLQLIASEPTRVSVAREPDGSALFEGQLNAGDRQALPLDKPFLLWMKAGKGLGLEIDGQNVAPPPVASGRWIVTVPTNPELAPSFEEAPPPFEAEVGPLVKAGRVNQTESDWLRAALDGDKGDPERALGRQLFSKDAPLTLGQWRARTALKFKPDAAALAAADPWQQARAIDLVLPPGGAEMRLLRIEPGQFRRGSPADEVGRRPSDLPVGVSAIAKPFFLGIYEVTQAQYESVMKRSPSYWRGNPSWPVDQVTWSNLMGNAGFLARLNAEVAKAYGGLLIADLPTDDEWEYACRAGTTTAFNNGLGITSIENDPALKNLAHYNKAGGGPRPVGSFDPNAWGLYDMHGNLQEWTQDRFVRGGSWSSKAAGCRSAARIQMSREASASNQTGFRLVLRLKTAE